MPTRPTAAARAASYGAMGIGLCRTERMFNATDRLPVVVDMILAHNTEERQAALDKLLPIQREDFKESSRSWRRARSRSACSIRRSTNFCPVKSSSMHEIEAPAAVAQDRGGRHGPVGAMRLMQPRPGYAAQPLSAKIRTDAGDAAIAKKELMLQQGAGAVRGQSHARPSRRAPRPDLPGNLRHADPRHARSSGRVPEGRHRVAPEIMVPQVCTAEELKRVKKLRRRVRDEVETEYGVTLKFKFGTMIEVVRACMRAGRLAEVAEFFSFGTNDLTQATFSFSREDAENKFLPLYNETGILQDNPFEVLDVNGVGQLMRMTVDWGRKQRPDLKVGHLRRAGRSSRLDPLLPPCRPELRILLAAAGTGGPAGGGPRRADARGLPHRLTGKTAQPLTNTACPTSGREALRVPREAGGVVVPAGVSRVQAIPVRTRRIITRSTRRRRWTLPPSEPVTQDRGRENRARDP